MLDLRQNRLIQLGEQVKEQLEQLPALEALANNIEIELTDEGLRIQLLEDSAGMFFETGGSRPSERGAAFLALLGANLTTLDNRIMIEGYTDARPYTRGAPYSNWELSADRANAARRILNAHGLQEYRVAQIRGWADRQLRDASDPLSPRNRRIAITVMLDRPGRDSLRATLGAGVPGQ